MQYITKLATSQNQKPGPLPQINYLCTYDLYSPDHNVLDACISITRASGRGLGPGIREFLGPLKWHRVDRRVPFVTLKRRGTLYISETNHPLRAASIEDDMF
jgi:hypothetical protein